MTVGPTGPTVTFLSDYGSSDEFTGVVRSVLRRLSPPTVVIDLCHEVPPHDVRSG
ncbi:MAG: SAM-dependent chlorinase/fluorinase, partial [Acidimicrobiales bacterium]|nr:SAM-dependent chlorinase/fluorinase [Acidimicrobiales bacterium]